MQRIFFALLLVTLSIAANEAVQPSRDANLRVYLTAEHPLRIQKISLDAGTVTILARIPSRHETVKLAELRIEDEISTPQSLKRQFDLQPIPYSDSLFTATLPRMAESCDRLLSRWVLVDASGSQPKRLSPAAWFTDFLTIAKTNTPLPKAPSKKGLNGIHPDPKLLPDLADLGCGHIALNVGVGGLLAAPGEKNTKQYDAGFIQVNIRDSAIATYDRVVSFCRQHNIVVTAILLNPREHQWKQLPHPDALHGPYSHPNVKTAEGARLYAAVIKFLAQRYSPASSIGRIPYWIVGNEVDAAWEWTNAGRVTTHEFMDQYVRALRIVYAMTRSYDANAKTFISLTHFWTAKGGGKDDPLYYRGRDLLEILNRYSHLEGDFEWALAHHPYPENLFNPKTWDDKSATDSVDTPRITFKNIEVLDRFMHQKEFLYQGEKLRTVFLSEQGFNSGKNSEEELRTQAAAFAYSWMKIKPLASIEAVQYHRWIDHEQEGGLMLGLWTVKEGTMTWPEKKKPSWELFQKFDTRDEESACHFALKIIGLSNWKAIHLPAPK